jgi:polar amino acid transport system substrate-binding protein
VITRQRARRAFGFARWSVLAVVTSAALTACGPGTDPSATSGGASAAGYPTQDVVSSLATDPALQAELPATVRGSGTLTLGTTIQPGTQGLPHAATINGQDVGVDVDLRNAVAKILGIRWNVQNGTFATIIPGVQNGKYDVGQDNFGVTAAREKVVDFATYLTDGQSFLGRDALPVDHVTTLTDLCGYTVATTPGSTFQQILTDGAGKCAQVGKKPYTVQYFSDSGPIFLGLANGKVDIFFGPTLGVRYDARHIPNTRFLGQISTTLVGFVTAKGSPLTKALRDAVNKLIGDGDYAEILAKWGVTSSGIRSSQVNPAATL